MYFTTLSGVVFQTSNTVYNYFCLTATNDQTTSPTLCVGSCTSLRVYGQVL